jgi:hypothetical protein
MTILAALALLLLPTTGSPFPRTPSPDGTEVPALRRIVVLGASLSHGYGLEKDAGAKLALADVVDASLRADHDPVRSKTSLLFFTDPLPTGKAQVAAAAAENPTLVVGIDYLFWFGYGFFPSEKDRLAMLEKGLAELEAFECPVLVGDFPDVSDAVGIPKDAQHPGRAGLLAAEQVPGADARKKLNDRLRAWAAGRKNVVVLPLADLVAHLHGTEDLEIHGNHWPKSALDGLVQGDHLHPTLEGTIALWIGAQDAIVAGRSDVPASAFDWDAGSISKRVHETVAARKAAKEKAKAAVGAAGGR